MEILKVIALVLLNSFGLPAVWLSPTRPVNSPDSANHYEDTVIGKAMINVISMGRTSSFEDKSSNLIATVNDVGGTVVEHGGIDVKNCTAWTSDEFNMVILQGASMKITYSFHGILNRPTSFQSQRPGVVEIYYPAEQGAVCALGKLPTGETKNTCGNAVFDVQKVNLINFLSSMKTVLSFCGPIDQK